MKQLKLIFQLILFSKGNLITIEKMLIENLVNASDVQQILFQSLKLCIHNIINAFYLGRSTIKENIFKTLHLFCLKNKEKPLSIRQCKKVV